MGRLGGSLREMASLEVPIIATVIGVGGSGGALAIAVADRVLMMENSIYSVISPEGCAAIMWRDATKKELAAEQLFASVHGLLVSGPKRLWRNHNTRVPSLSGLAQGFQSSTSRLSCPASSRFKRGIQ